MDLSSIARQASVLKKTTTKKIKTSNNEFNIVDEDAQDSTNSIGKTSAPRTSIPVFFKEEPSSQNKKHFMQGRAMLDELKKLRLELIQGRVTKDTLRHLDNLIQGKKNDSTPLSEELKNILDDIETRVTVELEKLHLRKQVENL